MHAGIDLVLVDKIVNEVKSQGVFDQFRKDSMADVDTKPAYQNLRQRVESTVSKFLSDQKWKSDLNKFQLREKLRKHIVDAGFLDTGVERIVDQVVNPKISAVFQPKIEDIAYKFLGIEKPHTSPKNYGLNGSLDIKTDLLPTDLEAVSPDSDKTKSESKEDIFNESIEERNEEYESPAFEPLDAVAAAASSPIKKEESDHSQLSGISGLTSQDSISSGNKANSPPPKFTSNNDTQPESDLSEVSSNSRLSIVTNEENSSASKPIVNKVADVDMSEEAQMPKFSENSEDIKVEHDLHFDIKRENIKFEGTERKGDSDLFNFGHHHDGGMKSEPELSNSTPEKNSISPSKPDEISAKDEKSSEIKVEEQDTFSTKNSLFIDERNECTQAIDMSMSENESSQETNNSDSMPKKKQSSNKQSNENMGAMFRPRPPSPPNDYMLQKPPSPNYYMKPFPPPPPTPPPPPPPGDSYVQPPLPPPPESSLPPIPPTPPSLPPLPPIPANPPPPGEEPPLPGLPPMKEREAPRPPSPPMPREESSFHLKPNPPEYRTDEQHLLSRRSMAEEKSPRSPDDFDYNETKFQRETPIKYSTRSTPPRYPPSPPLRGFADAEGYYQDRYERDTYREKEKEKRDSYNMPSTRETKEEYKPQSSISDRSSLREIGREKDNSNSSLYSPTSAPQDQYSPDDKHNMEIKRDKDTLRSPPSPEQRGDRNKYGKESPRYSTNKPSWSPRSPKYRPPSPPNIKSPATPEPYSPHERWDRRPPSPKTKPHTPPSPKAKPHTPPSPKAKPHTPLSPKAKPHTPPSPKAKPHTPPDPYTNMEDQGTPVNDEYIHSPSPPPYEELRPNSPNSIDLKSISSKETSFSHSENSQNESTSKPPSPFSPTQKASSKDYETMQRHSTSHSKSTCDSKSDVDILKPPSTTSHSKSSSRSSSHHSHHHKSSKSSKDDRSSTKSSSHRSSSSSSRHHTSSSSHRSSEDKKHSSSSSSSNRHKSSKSDSKQRDRDRDREREKDRDRKKDDHSSARHKERRRKSTDSNDGNNRRHGSKHGSSSGSSSRHGQERSGHGTTNKESGTHSNSSGNLSSNSNSCNNSSRHHTTSRSNNKNKERSSKSHKEDALELFIITEEEKQTTETKIAQLDNAIKARKLPVYLMDCEEDYQEAFKTFCENVISILGKSIDNNSITLEANQTDVEDISMKSSIDLTITNGVARKRKALNPYRTPYKSLTAANEKLREAHCLLIDCCDYDKHSKLPRLDENRADVSPTSSDMSVSSKENEFMGGKNKKAKLQTPKNGGFIKAQGIVRIEKSGGVGNGFKVNNQRYSSEDLYKPRPLIPRPRRRELLDDQNLV